MTETASIAVKGEKLGVGTALLDGALGYLVVFIGLILLMCVVIVVGKIMVSKSKAKKTAAAPAAAICCIYLYLLPIQRAGDAGGFLDEAGA